MVLSNKVAPFPYLLWRADYCLRSISFPFLLLLVSSFCLTWCLSTESAFLTVRIDFCSCGSLSVMPPKHAIASTLEFGTEFKEEQLFLKDTVGVPACIPARSNSPVAGFDVGNVSYECCVAMRWGLHSCWLEQSCGKVWCEGRELWVLCGNEMRLVEERRREWGWD